MEIGDTIACPVCGASATVVARSAGIVWIAIRCPRCGDGYMADPGGRWPMLSGRGNSNADDSAKTWRDRPPLL